MVTFTDDEIWDWYQHVMTQQGSGISSNAYARIHGLDRTALNRMIFRFIWKRDNHKKYYEKLLPITMLFRKSGIAVRDFAKQHDVQWRHIQEMSSHLEYNEAIEQIKLRRGEPQIIPEPETPPAPEPVAMDFIPIPKISAPMPVIPQAPYHEYKPEEVLEARNSIELIISKGVKVIVAPEVGAEKLIKIIELLKDL